MTNLNTSHHYFGWGDFGNAPLRFARKILHGLSGQLKLLLEKRATIDQQKRRFLSRQGKIKGNRDPTPFTSPPIFQI